ncbi:hypothetical protein [Peristeroidobacter agariperforans]|uniref:hypothetical protein n=1 Tax=Peristeroidobacter agariperforans TaxID=268404 RepID=UPI00101BF1C8|nr:hypothetical protein [Peristeroidobacter agariperforans]
MKRAPSIVLAAALGVCGSAQDVRALTLIPTFPAALTAAEKAALERLVCKDTHHVPAEGIEAWSYDRATANASADVLCRSHEAIAGKPVRYFARCERKEKSWSCQSGDIEVLVSVGTRELAVRWLGGIDRTWGVKVIEKLVADGWFRKELDAGESPQCDVGPGSAPEWVDVKCAGWAITVSSWCPQEACPRIVSAHWGTY